jgi:DNA-binding CsgD family transcriptional regulator
MQHVAVLVNLISLIFGVIAGSTLITRYRTQPSKLLSKFLNFFFAYSYLIIVAALFSYLVINVSSVSWIQSLFACLIFIGMSFLILTLPMYIFEEMGQKMPPWFRKMIWIAAIVTGLQAPVLWFTAHNLGVVLPLIIAFLPFLFVITITKYKHRVYNKKNAQNRIKNKNLMTFYIFVLFFILAGIETFYGSYIYHEGKFIVISLPFAYSLSAIQIIKKYSNHPGGADQSLTEQIFSEFNLTSREIEMAKNILAGATNKEIAYDLNLSQNTVRNHIYNLYQKLGIQKRMDLLKLIKHD